MPLKNKIFLLFSFALLNFSMVMGNANAAGCTPVSNPADLSGINLSDIGTALNNQGVNIGSSYAIYEGYQQLQCLGASGVDITQRTNISVGIRYLDTDINNGDVINPPSWVSYGYPLTGDNAAPTVVIKNSTLTSFHVLNGVTISNADSGLAISIADSNSNILDFTNDGRIESPYNSATIYNFGTISSFTNNGTIYRGASNAGFNVGDVAAIVNVGTITSLINLGSISVDRTPDTIAIKNAGIINNLDNAQGKTSTPLTYVGVLPTNYNIVVRGPSDFGQFSATSSTGNMTFRISNLSSAGSSVIGTTLDNVLTGIIPSQLLNSGASSLTTSGQYITVSSTNGLFSGNLIFDGTNSWDLLMLSTSSGPSAADTQASLSTQARRLRSTFNSTMASGNFANMNTYDCNLFDKNNMCISAGGRYTNIDNPSSNNSAAVVVLGYKVNSNIRIGGFLDQSINNNSPTGINVSNKNPMMGAFAVWNKNADGLGYQVKIANAYQDKDVRSTRDAYGETGEAGTGKTNLNTQSYVGELSYAFNYQDSTLVRPYLALRYTNIKQDAYTETGVSTPLSYGKLGDRSTTALMGVKLNHALNPRTNLTASLGLEQDLHHKTDQLVASGVADLTSENFNNRIKRTRPVASAGAYYAVTQTQRLSGEVYYQQLPFQSTGSATAYVNYMIGF